MKPVIITGSRNYTDKLRLFNILNQEHAKEPFDHLIHGDALGADYLADCWARARGLQVTPVPADWYPNGRYDRSAGPRRNREMLDMFPEARIIGFPIGESRGTRGCMAEAKKRGMQVTVYETSV
jgi:hypothetical protein